MDVPAPDLETDQVIEVVAPKPCDSIRRAPAADGFTLIEVVVVVAIVAILTAIAIPQYVQYVARGHRSEARMTLTHAAQWMERWRTERGTYLGAALPPSLQGSPASGARVYNITVVPAAATYTLTATPIGPMAADGCGNLTLDNTGLRNSTGATNINICWGR